MKTSSYEFNTFSNKITVIQLRLERNSNNFFWNNDANTSIDADFREVVNEIPRSLEFSKKSSARIIIGKKIYTSTNWSKMPASISSKIIVNGKIMGVVEVFFPSLHSEIKNPQIPQNDRLFINLLAEKLGYIVQRYEHSLRENEIAGYRS